MPSTDKKFRFLLINAFSLPEGARYRMRPSTGPKEASLMNHASVAPLLADVAWDLHPGVPATHGDWPVETREEFMLVGANRLPVVREACESGRYNAIVLLGGGDPGLSRGARDRPAPRRSGDQLRACADAGGGDARPALRRCRHIGGAQHADGAFGAAIRIRRVLRLDSQHQHPAAAAALRSGRVGAGGGAIGPRAATAR